MTKSQQIARTVLIASIAIILLGLLGKAMLSAAKSTADNMFVTEIAGKWENQAPPKEVLEIQKDNTFRYAGKSGKWHRDRGDLVLEGLAEKPTVLHVMQGEMFEGTKGGLEFKKLKP